MKYCLNQSKCLHELEYESIKKCDDDDVYNYAKKADVNPREQ